MEDAGETGNAHEAPTFNVRYYPTSGARADIVEGPRRADFVAKVTAESKTRNNRIGAKEFLDQRCALMPDKSAPSDTQKTFCNKIRHKATL
jgi:hypothetical protein